MIIDASAVIAILSKEPGWEELLNALGQTRLRVSISPVNYLEVGLKVDRAGREYAEGFDEMMLKRRIEIASITSEQARIAREAYRRYGKGNHPARLNIGDCFAYALAKARGEPLLFKGDDFAQTDIQAAI